jgi:glutamine synthetase
VILHAGLEGITNFQIQSKRIYNLSDEERKRMGIESLPGSLGEAIAITERSELVRKALDIIYFQGSLNLRRKSGKSIVFRLLYTR